MSTTDIETINIPSSPQDRKDLFLSVRQLSDSMARQKGESDFQKEEVKALSKKYKIKTKHLRNMAKDHCNHSFEEKTTENEEYEELYNAIIKHNSKVTNQTDDDDEESED